MRTRRIGKILVLAALAALGLSTSLLAQNPAATINVDANASRHAISPLVYGVAYGGANLSDLNCPVNRYGGNNTSRYNWQINADNRGQDWYFESIAEPSATAGERGDTFIQKTKAAGAEPMITVPILDWIAKLGTNRGKLASFSQAKYGAQTGNDAQWFPDAGNGVLKSTGANVTGNDPNDADVANAVGIEQAWAQHLVATWGTAASGGLKYYILDNEHSIWHSTHRDVHPTGATMDEIRQKMIDYASAIKAVDPSALVVGPEEWGWSGYFYSGYDQQYGAAHNWCCFPDKQAHGNADYLPWLLDQLHQYEVANGKRLLDVFSVHYYPQGGEFGNDTSTTMQQLRNRSTRSLWDPGYVDATWINDTVELIPRIKGWVATYSPGLKTAITEYNWGAEGHINGATTQADIFGIFGREGLDIGTRWTTPDPTTPTYKAMKVYRNYDGQKSTFGDTSVAATSTTNADNLSAFAAQRSSDNAMTVMVIAKYLTGTTPVTVSLASFTPGATAQWWRLKSTNVIERVQPGNADIPLSGGSFSATLDPQSINLFVIAPSGGAPNVPPTASATATPTSGIVPLAVSFDGSASSDSDGTIASYTWTFGDGATASGATASHTYTTTGTFTAKLMVADDKGATGSQDLTITVSPDPNVIAAPSGLSAGGGKGIASLKWSDNSSNETGFYVDRAPQGSSSFSRVATLAANATGATLSTPSGKWSFRVQAFSATTGRVSAYSNVASTRVR